MALTQLPQDKQLELEKILDALKATVDHNDPLKHEAALGFVNQIKSGTEPESEKSLAELKVSISEETQAKESAQNKLTNFFSKNDYSFDSLQKTLNQPKYWSIIYVKTGNQIVPRKDLIKLINDSFTKVNYSSWYRQLVISLALIKSATKSFLTMIAVNMSFNFFCGKDPQVLPGLIKKNIDDMTKFFENSSHERQNQGNEARDAHFFIPIRWACENITSLFQFLPREVKIDQELLTSTFNALLSIYPDQSQKIPDGDKTRPILKALDQLVGYCQENNVGMPVDRILDKVSPDSLNDSTLENLNRIQEEPPSPSPGQ